MLTRTRQRNIPRRIFVLIVAFLFVLTAIGIWYIVDVRPREREVMLKQELKSIRRMIDQYALDKHQLPRSLDDLVQAGYVREIPIDPITQKRDWHIKMGEDTVSRGGGMGLVDVYSNAQGLGRNGILYAEY